MTNTHQQAATVQALAVLDEQITVEMADVQDGLATLQRLLRQRRRVVRQLQNAASGVARAGQGAGE